MYKQQEIKTKCKCIIVLTMVILHRCNSTILHSNEGESVQLEFPYPCNNSRVTLQYGNRAPAYSSAHPESMSLPSNQHLTNQNASDECSLHLTINPVSRNDAGTYILTAYDEDGQYMYDERVGLRVNYPPGEASCGSSDAYLEGEWIRLHCSAPVGNLAGQIICYQNGMRLPPSTSPDEIDITPNKIILARSKGSLVYCCSSTVQQTKDMCECKDCAWDPSLNSAIANVTDPCPIVPSTTTTTTTTTTTQVPSTHRHPTETFEPTLHAMIITKIDLEKEMIHDYLVTVISVIAVILIVTCFFIAVHYHKQLRYYYMRIMKIISPNARPRIDEHQHHALDMEEAIIWEKSMSNMNISPALNDIPNPTPDPKPIT